MKPYGPRAGTANRVMASIRYLHAKKGIKKGAWRQWYIRRLLVEQTVYTAWPTLGLKTDVSSNIPRPLLIFLHRNTIKQFGDYRWYPRWELVVGSQNVEVVVKDDREPSGVTGDETRAVHQVLVW